jgi:hypothetical protein
VTVSVIDWVMLAIICDQQGLESSVLEGGGGSLEAEEAAGRGGAKGVLAIEINSTGSKASGVR